MAWRGLVEGALKLKKESTNDYLIEIKVLQDRRLRQSATVLTIYKKNKASSRNLRASEPPFPGALTSPSPPECCGELRQEENIDKITRPCNLQRTDRYLRQMQRTFLQEVPRVLRLMLCLLEGKKNNLSLTSKGSGILGILLSNESPFVF